MQEGTSFGQWLKQRRKSLDLSQEELAERIGCSDIAIRKIEAGERRPSRQIAQLIVGYLKVPAEESEAFIRFARGLDHLPKAPEVEASFGGPGNLPARRTHIIGREDITAEITSRLAQDDVRLLTLTGPPGVGKTSLALCVASGVARQELGLGFRDGVYFVSLAFVSETGMVAAAIAKVLGLTEPGDVTVEESLTAYLQGKQLLLLLDNFEQVVEAAPLIARILERCPDLKAMVTSREPLLVQGECLFRVPPLEVPAGDLQAWDNPSTTASRHAMLAAVPSVALFVERASALEPDFALTEQNAGAVAAICIRLEGLPLAIELAAARVRILTPEEIETRLEKQLKLLTGGRRDLPARQQTLRSAIDWSYALLTYDEQTFFRRLGVFVGGCTLAAAEAVCNARSDLPLGVLEAIESLLDKSLLKRGESLAGESRYTMLEMIREYAIERLEADERSGYAGVPVDGADHFPSQTAGGSVSSAESIRRKHAEYFLALAEAAELQQATADQGRWLDILEGDHDNLRAAIQWAIEGGEASIAAALCGALTDFWVVRGYLSEGRRWLDKVLAHAAEISPRTLAKAAEGAGVLARVQGDYQVAASQHKHSLAIFRDLDDTRGTAGALNHLAVDVHYMDDTMRAEELYEESLELWRRLGDTIGVSKLLNNLGLIALGREDYARSVELFRQAVEVYRAARHTSGICSGLYNLGISLASLPSMTAEGREEVVRCFTESLALARELGHKTMIASNLAKLGELSLEAGDESSLVEATILFQDALEMHSKLSDKASVAYTLDGLGFVWLLRGDREKARELFEEALRLGRELEDNYKVGMTLLSLAITAGATALASSSREAAQRSARRAVQLHSVTASFEFPISHPFKEPYDRVTMDALHNILSHEEIEALQALGRKMSIEEAVVFALAY